VERGLYGGHLPHASVQNSHNLRALNCGHLAMLLTAPTYASRGRSQAATALPWGRPLIDNF